MYSRVHMPECAFRKDFSSNWKKKSEQEKWFPYKTHIHLSKSMLLHIIAAMWCSWTELRATLFTAFISADA